MVSQVGNQNMRVQRQGLMRGGECMPVETFSGSGLVAMKAGAIPGSMTGGFIRHSLATGEKSNK
jgi:hypothetical protein